jgi:hypothetical protein
VIKVRGTKINKVLAAVAVFVAALSLSLSAVAQDKPAKEKSKAAPAGKAKKAADTGGDKKVIRLEAIKVEGKIQKPQAYYFLPRSNLNIEGLELNESFVPKIIKSVEEDPF